MTTSSCQGTFSMVRLLALLLPQNVTPLISMKSGCPRSTNLA